MKATKPYRTDTITIQLVSDFNTLEEIDLFVSALERSVSMLR